MLTADLTDAEVDGPLVRSYRGSPLQAYHRTQNAAAKERGRLEASLKEQALLRCPVCSHEREKTKDAATAELREHRDLLLRAIDLKRLVQPEL